MTMLAHVFLSANDALEKRRLFNYAKKHNLTWALEDTDSNAIEDTGRFTYKGETYYGISQYSKLDRDDSDLEGYTTRVMDEFDNRVSVANAAHELRNRLFIVEYKMGQVMPPFILNTGEKEVEFELTQSNIFSSNSSRPYAFEALLGRFVVTYGIVEPLVVAIHVVAGMVKISGDVKGKIAKKRRAKKAKKEQAQKAANEARQKKLAEWKKVEAYNNEIKYVDSGMYTLDKAVVGVEYAKVNKNRKVAKLTTKGGISLYVLFPYSNNKNLSFCWRDEVNIPRKMTVRSEMGQEKIVAAIQKKYNDIQAVKAKVGHKQFGE